jgi:16S rRNA (cytosine1402-N4)-methyltransferase
VEPDAWYVDGTLGGGGYSVGILGKGGKIIGIDQDKEALRFAKSTIEKEYPDKQEGKDWILVHDNFRNVQTIVTSVNKQVKGMVLDLGVSSFQLDTRERGFSYRFEDAPLDMRMNQDEGIPASSILNSYSQEELYDIFTLSFI